LVGSVLKQTDRRAGVDGRFVGYSG